MVLIDYSVQVCFSFIVPEKSTFPQGKKRRRKNTEGKNEKRGEQFMKH